MLVPKLFTSLRGYTRRQFSADATAGVIVGIVALPLAIAFAVASGVSPERGLYTAIVAGFIVSVLGGSRVQIGGPTGAFVVIVYGIVQTHGIDGLLVATLMAGVILVACGIARLGAIIKFIPYPVVVGFTSGIAVIIFTTQIKDFFGLTMGAVPAGFVEAWLAYAEQLGSINPVAGGVAIATMIIVRYWPHVSRRVPAPFVALIALTTAVSLLALPLETIGSRFGEIHFGLPSPSFPTVSLTDARALVGPAVTIAILAAIESLLSAVIADGMIGGRHRSNMELVAQGVANIASPLFGGIPATGAIARTATNVKSGGRTPVAGIIHAITLLLITLFFGHYAALIPMAVLAGILVGVAWHMSEWRTFRSLLRAPRSDVAVLVTTFALTVLVDLTVAIQVGMVLAAFLFMKRMADVTDVRSVADSLNDPEVESTDTSGAVFRRQVPDGVAVYEINGPFFFGAASAFSNAVEQVASKPRVLIIRMRHVPAIDATGLHALQVVVDRARRDRTRLIIVEVQAQPRGAIDRIGLGVEIVASLDVALAMAATPPPS